ncbi:MAG: diacylglycerol kinase [Burkholderiaceae bacterium]|nr:diacylglycerol kinase [Burkholderiaceae bacterium]
MTVELREGGRPTGLNRLVLATQNSLRGIANCYRNESAFRQEVWAACVLIPAGLWLGRTGVERLLLVGAVLLLMLVEIVNSAIEAVVDRVSTDRHPLSGYAKDLGSAAVFFALLLLFSTWMLVLWDRVA